MNNINTITTQEFDEEDTPLTEEGKQFMKRYYYRHNKHKYYETTTPYGNLYGRSGRANIYDDTEEGW